MTMDASTETPADSPPLGTLSPSRASDFMTCPLLYRFRVIDRLPERPTQAATRGTVVHGVLERLFDLPAAERTPEAAAAMAEPEWERLLAAEPELGQLFPHEGRGETGAGSSDQTGDRAGNKTGGETGDDYVAWMASVHDMLRRYFTLEDPRRLEPAQRELYVQTVLDSGLGLRGYIDRLDVAPTGEVRIVDYKTGTAPNEVFEARALFQMKFYALVLWRTRGEIPRMLQLIYLGNGEVLRYQPDEAELRATERKLEALWQAIERAVRTGEWRARPSRLCDWCDHQVRCPAYGGTPPPLPADAPVRADSPPSPGYPPPARFQLGTGSG